MYSWTFFEPPPDATAESIEHYETLDKLMERWEYEIVEFKSGTGQYSEDKIGQYFSAISNEANLRAKQYGWFVLGVSEGKDKHVVGTAFKRGDSQLLEKVKHTIGSKMTDNITFLEIIELFPICNEKQFRVLMFKVPAAAAGMPTACMNHYYARNGDSLIPLQQYKIDIIRSQGRSDWSRQTIQGSTIKDLDQDAISYAREKYKEKMSRPHISEEVDAMTDEEFLAKIRLIDGGLVTNAAMVLLGKSESDSLFDRPPRIMWRLFDPNGMIVDYELFTIPFILVANKVFSKIRNLTYRYIPDQQSLFSQETQQYDTWLTRELLNNCIAHSNYQLGGRIYINEFPDSLIFSNPGDFLPQSIETVLQASYNPPFYRNQLLADSMAKFRMIDTATSGIKKIYRIQKDKFFPMPDYNISPSQVSVRIYGRTIDERYTYILHDRPNLDLETVYLLDQVQKGNGKTLSRDAIALLRKHGLVEGRSSSLYLSAAIAKNIEQEAQYIKNRGFTDKYYRDLIILYINQFGKAKRSEIRNLLWDKLPDSLTDEQKEFKISTLLANLKRNDIIQPNSPNRQQSSWIPSNNFHNSLPT